MTKMTGALALMAFVLCATALKAQELKIPVSAGQTITLLDFPGELAIEGYSGTDLLIDGGSPNETPERAKGLKPIYPGGEDNTGQGMSMEKNGNEISLRYLPPYTRPAKNYKIKIPDGAYLKIKSGCERETSLALSNLKGEVDADVCHDIKLTNVTGPLVLSTINGNVDVSFTMISKDKPISIATVNGEINVSLPAATPANIEMSNIVGNMYSDFDFHTDDKNMKKVGGNSVKTQINGGGVDIKLHSINGNIYLRKS